MAGNDTGKYNCSAVNILGKAHALVELVVNGKFVVTPAIVWIEGRLFWKPQTHLKMLMAFKIFFIYLNELLL